MKTDNSSHEPNQGEGDKLSARHYNRQVRDFVAAGKVDPAAQDAAKFVDEQPEEAQRAEAAAKHGPGTKVTIDELVAKGRSVIERVRPVVEGAVDKVRAKLGRPSTK
ncbi:MAG TPA: hypothetical protein VGC42_29430 [Kofleriaceae bacterium]